MQPLPSILTTTLMLSDRRVSGAGLGPQSTLEQLEGAWGDDPRWAALDVPAKARCVLGMVPGRHNASADKDRYLGDGFKVRVVRTACGPL